MQPLTISHLSQIDGGADGDAAYGVGVVLGVVAAVALFPLLPAIAFYDIYTNHL
ncbi:hypothetical protein LEM8419_02082 [Neolewinella maritima]|uniref:Uncharacterized protein n=1 Tax=Neolewinella maritima TaxID=1383882 RepID=A0ABM9B2Q0_9BACT|nr:hypothetical protein LEM8419_02082 [Neolewinella maritima]